MEVFIGKVPYLDINQSALAFGERRMFTVTGATYPASLRVGAKLIVKDAFQNKNLLAAGMHVGIKHRIGSPAH
jgi:hypothetical protein